jgi:hypothetical protein
MWQRCERSVMLSPRLLEIPRAYPAASVMYTFSARSGSSFTVNLLATVMHNTMHP